MNLRYGTVSYMVVLLASAPAALLRAYVLVMLWTWFAVPLGMPSIGKAHAYGLAVLVGLATFSYPPIKDKDIAEAGSAIRRDAQSGEKSLWVATKLVMMFVPSLVFLAYGYAAKLAMGW